MKKLIAFDLDDTLAVTKSPITDRMSELLGRLLEGYHVCVISGGKYEQFTKQITSRLPSGANLPNLHLMPTCGTRYYKSEDDKWRLQYSEDLSKDQKKQIFEALESVAKDMGLWCENPAGEIIEDRFSQITMSALGQEASAEDKYAWAEKNKAKRLIYRDRVAALLPDLEVRIGGTTSTDITLPGIDKAFGMQRLLESLSITKDQVLFVGDKLEEGGNDYPVKAMGIDSIAVKSHLDTELVVETLVIVAGK